MTIDFGRIRVHNGSQQDGFEELCCQLAGCDRPNDAVRFIRNAPPDAGVECYWELSNGDEHGWQAKYFDTVGDSQWRQLDESVKTALAKHPRLVRYVVCLPIDLPDARINRRKSLRERWEDRVALWEGLASAQSMSVSFELWSKHDLTVRLVEQAQAGRRLYWFGNLIFARDWFVSRLQEAVHYAGARYSPELHVELPLFRVFEGLGNTPAFHGALRSRLEAVREQWRDTASRLQDVRAAGALGGTLITLQEHYLAAVMVIERYGAEDFPPVEDTLGALQAAAGAAHACMDALHQWNPSTQGDIPAARDHFPFEWEARSLGRFAEGIESLLAYCFEPELRLISRPALLLIGPGGCGKTHALCDLANRRMAASWPTLLLLGQQLGGPNPWQAMIAQLGLACTRDDLLGALEAAAQATGSRALILIDAINEARSIRWRDELPAMLEVLRRYPRVGLVVSCKDVNENELIREDVARAGFIRVEHTGFLGRIEEAIRSFGREHHVTELHVPVLSPEFASPLFLKLFFQAKRMRTGADTTVFTGLADLFKTIVRDLDERLSNRDQLDYHPSEKRVQRAVERIATLMFDSRCRFVHFAQALEELRQIHPATDFSASLLAGLIDAGILAEDVVRVAKQEYRVVRFSYDRHAEHCVAEVILSRVHSERGNTQADLPTLRWLLEDENAVAQQGSQGLIIATCGLAPAFLGLELFEVAPWVRTWRSFAHLYLAGLVLRPHTSIGTAAVAFTQELLRTGSVAEPATVYTALLQVSVVPQHPLNARWLHGHLLALPMAERDAVWSTFLHWQFARRGPITKLIDWAWPEDCETRDPAAHVDPETVRLASLCLGWCLTTPNRFLRDQATKALVSLLWRRLDDAIAFIEALGQVDDPYVMERVFAVAYGCILRSGDLERIARVAKTVFNIVFANEPPSNVLTRDYARGCIERALSLGCLSDTDVDVRRIRPPYDSAPLIPPLTWDALRTSFPEEQFRMLHFALDQSSDFFRYVLTGMGIGGEDGWTSVPPARRHRKLKRYTDGSPEEQLTLDHALRWILQRIVEFGWTPERFDQFDRDLDSCEPYRAEHKPERMGKKYQWIALREFLGRLLDRCPYRYFYHQADTYQGAWQMHLRDTDPSFLSRRETADQVQPSTWWVPVPDPVGLGATLDDSAWLRLLAPLPDPMKLPIVTEPGNGRNWSVLSLNSTWQESADAMESRRAGTIRRVGLALSTWLMPCKGVDALLASLWDWEYAGNDFGETVLYRHFLGEYFWAPSFESLRKDGRWNFKGEPGNDSTQAFAPAWKSVSVAATSHRYIAEGGGYDCSLIESVSGYLPSVWLAQRLRLRWARHHFRCVGEDGRLVSFDPAAEVGGPGALLICRDTLTRFLRKQRLALVTAVVGEKNVRNPRGRRPDETWSGKLVFRRLLRDDGKGPALVRAWASLPGRGADDELLEDQ